MGDPAVLNRLRKEGKTNGAVGCRQTMKTVADAAKVTPFTLGASDALEFFRRMPVGTIAV